MYLLSVSSLPTKLEIYHLRYNYIGLTSIIYGDRTIIGFMDFVANVLTDQQMAPRSASEKELFFVRL
jgi:hypothetical protein